jgi:hypothetical protein
MSSLKLVKEKNKISTKQRIIVFFLFSGDSIQNSIDKTKQVGEVVSNKVGDGTKLVQNATQEIVLNSG